MADFAKLLEENLKQRKRIEPGSIHSSVIVTDSKDFYLIRTENLGIQGIVNKDEFSEEKEFPKLGGRLELYFLEENSGDYLFTHSLYGESITSYRLELSLQSDIPVWGQVVQSQTNGYSIKLGDFLAFCPFSQFEPIYKGLDLIGKKFKFVVTSFDNKKIQVSQRKISDAERMRRIEILRSEWKVGSYVSTQITSILKNGLQVKTEGLEGFVPMSEASFRPNPDLMKEFTIGETLRGKILELDWNKNRFILSVKDFLKDPWTNKIPFQLGDIWDGTIDQIKPFGFFVKLNDEFMGLVPNREISESKKMSSNKIYSIGEKVKVFISEINPERRQITLSIIKAKETEDRLDYQKYLVSENDAISTSSFGLALKKSLQKKKV